jgi:hypothetical protein
MVEAGFSNAGRGARKSFARLPLVRVRCLDTWQGRSIPHAEASAKCRSLGLEVLDIENEWTTMMWIGGEKKSLVG